MNCGEVMYENGLAVGSCAMPYGVEHSHSDGLPPLIPLPETFVAEVTVWRGEIAMIRRTGS